jgi:hypothetical protein
MRRLTFAVILIALAGCQSAEDRARVRVEEANTKMRAEFDACRSVYPVERNTIINRVRCLNDAHSAYPYHRYPDLIAVFNAERLLAAERFRDGKTSEAEYGLEVANAGNKATSIHHSRENANRPPPPLMHMHMHMPPLGMPPPILLPCPPGPNSIACRGF